MRHDKISLLVCTLGLWVTLTGISKASEADQAVLALFEKRCAECHRTDEEPSLHKDMILTKLRDDPKYVLPGDSNGSELYQRVLLPEESKKRMPKSKGKPGDSDYRPLLTSEEKEVMKQWIEGKSTETVARAFISNDQIDQAIASDLGSLGPDSRKEMRYLTLTNLFNMRDAKGQTLIKEEEMAAYRAGIGKLLNSLSYNPKIAVPAVVDKEGTIVRVRLADYGMTADFWERIVSFYPYQMQSTSVPFRKAREMSGTSAPGIRGDWFAFALSQPPLYHEALDIPGMDGQEGSDAALEQRLGINVKRNLLNGKALRAGFEKSGVSQGNRLIERHLQRDGGAYWKSYDFDKNRKNQVGGDLFTAPLGPADAALAQNVNHIFHHDGGELIFTLPNGLQGYILVNAKGQLLNRAPVNIVHDSSRKDSAIINGISCMSCHKAGMLSAPKDEIASVAARLDLDAAEDTLIKNLYVPPQMLETAQAGDSKRFVKALEALQIDPASKTEPVRLLYERFLADITFVQLASEFGESTEDFLADLEKSNSENVRAMTAKLKQGGTLPRQSFFLAFQLIANELGLGTVVAPANSAFEEFGTAGLVAKKDQPLPLPNPPAIPNPLPPQKNESVFLFPESSDKVLSPSQLSGLSKEELAAARNEIFARKGMIFTTTRGKAVAARLEAAGLYTPVSEDQDAIFNSLNSVEQRNVEQLKALEFNKFSDSPNPTQTPLTPVQSPFLYPDSSERILSDGELSGLSKEELSTARNEIYARHGMIFSSPKGKALAAKLAKAGFYTPVTKDQDVISRRFNAVEKANVEKIKSYE